MSKQDDVDWSACRSFPDLCSKMAETFRRGHGDVYNYRLMDETWRIADSLAVLNQTGFLTTWSQPACSGESMLVGWEETPRRVTQRAYVSGYTTPELARLIVTACAVTRLDDEEAGLDCYVQPVVAMPDHYDPDDHPTTISSRDADTGEWLSAHPHFTDWSFHEKWFSGVGDGAFRDLDDLVHVAVIDRTWGREGVLWQCLKVAVTQAPALLPYMDGEPLMPAA